MKPRKTGKPIAKPQPGQLEAMRLFPALGLKALQECQRLSGQAIPPFPVPEAHPFGALPPEAAIAQLRGLSLLGDFSAADAIFLAACDADFWRQAGRGWSADLAALWSLLQKPCGADGVRLEILEWLTEHGHWPDDGSGEVLLGLGQMAAADSLARSLKNLQERFS